MCEEPKVIWAWRKERRKMTGLNAEVTAEQSWSGEQNVLPQVMESMGAAKYHHDDTLSALQEQNKALMDALKQIAKDLPKPDGGMTDFGERQHYLYVAARLRDRARAALEASKQET